MSTDQFARNVVQRVAARLLEEQEFDAIEQTALDTITDVFVKCTHKPAPAPALDSALLTAAAAAAPCCARPDMTSLAKRIKNYAELGGRTEANVCDALEALTWTVGADRSTVYRNAREYAAYAESDALPHQLQAFPVAAAQAAAPATKEADLFADESNAGGDRPAFLPNHLPAFPRRRTFVHTAVYQARVTDERTLRELREKQRRQVESTLLDLAARQPSSSFALYEPAALAHTTRSVDSIARASGVALDGMSLAENPWVHVTQASLDEPGTGAKRKRAESDEADEDEPAAKLARTTA